MARHFSCAKAFHYCTMEAGSVSLLRIHATDASWPTVQYQCHLDSKFDQI